MNPLASIGAWLKRVAAPRAGVREIAALLQTGPGTGFLYNYWTQNRLEQVRHYKHWVFVGIDKIATKVATQMPNVSVVRTPERAGRRERHLSPFARAKALTPLQSHEQLEPVRDSHPLLRLLKDPNDPDTAFDLWYETVMFLFLTGNAYWWAPRNAVGLPGALWVLPSHWVYPLVGKERIVEAYHLRPVEGNYLTKTIPADEVVHFRRKSPVSKIDGYSPLEAGNQWIDTQESIDRSRFFAFKNGTQPGIVVEFDPNVQDPADEVINRALAKWDARYTGEHRSNRPIFIPPGARAKKLQVTPEEMAFCESAAQTRDQILALLGVPASVAQVATQMTYGSVVATHSGFCTFTINPLCRFLGQVVTEKLAVPFYDEHVRVWWEDTTPEDPELREKQIATDLLGAAITPNEQRALRGREPYPHGGNDPVVNGNLAVVGFGTGGPSYALVTDGGSQGGHNATDNLDMRDRPTRSRRLITSPLSRNGAHS